MMKVLKLVVISKMWFPEGNVAFRYFFWKVGNLKQRGEAIWGRNEQSTWKTTHGLKKTHIMTQVNVLQPFVEKALKILQFCSTKLFMHGPKYSREAFLPHTKYPYQLTAFSSGYESTIVDVFDSRFHFLFHSQYFLSENRKIQSLPLFHSQFHLKNRNYVFKFDHKKRVYPIHCVPWWGVVSDSLWGAHGNTCRKDNMMITLVPQLTYSSRQHREEN